MLYQISHTTHYAYDQPVTLQPHIIRLCPRSDYTQALKLFSLQISPIPKQESPIVDLDGNPLIKAWFAHEPTTSLTIQTLSQVETYRENPFIYLLEPWAAHLPIDYPASLLGQLQPYLIGSQMAYTGSGFDPIAQQLAQNLLYQVDGNTIRFLSELNQLIYESCTQEVRDTGHPHPPSITWTQKRGSCRDYTVLFMEVCRAIGIPARFVSGYQEGDVDSTDRHLHAWAEVYLPGAGWRGYDPTHGLAVADRHIALVASAVSRYAAPVTGAYGPPGVQATMTYELMIQPL
ncbi:transglutaminase family protein [Pantanalinema sp. GBBB05]|uniref:transglutaminase family protein n=1 Tax=Pantanalinema sp. GBBB05 TaxID=2604139 RepID=UPI001D280905|nr:transglutaminase family protein [Pantanalinema sp. GBBB05]